MKTLYFVICIVSVFSVYSQKKQKPKKADWTLWSDSVAFYQGEEPLIRGFGALSDTLSSLYDDKIFYEYNGGYYVINSLKDYYYWFTQKYPFLFKSSVEQYEAFYESGDDFKMARFVKHNYTGRRLPIRFKFRQDMSGNYPISRSATHQNIHLMPSIDYTPRGTKYIRSN